ncbi:MAG: OmpH family outer membrane protein [Alphaproteobacteria bacterium]|nr:OmpH family outer membrane protein [Alphaproteobacteria bacterium]
MRFCALASAVFCFALVAGAVLAADIPAKLPPPIIAIVDMQRLMQDSLAAKSMKKQLDAQRSKFQNEIEGEENQLRDAEQELTKERGKTDPQAYADHEQQLRQRFATVETHVQERRKVLDQTYTDSMDAVHSALMQVVNDVAHEHGANIAIVKQQALWTDQPLDITDEVLKRLDEKLPRVTVPVSGKSVP